MNTQFKKQAFYTLIIAVVFLNVTTNTAASEIQNSGDDTSIANTQQQTENDTIVANNSAEISQDVVAEANTGHNIAERNISIGGNAGMITTGDAGVVTTAHIAANENTYLATGGQPGTPQASNSLANTGNSLNVHSSNEVTQMTMVQNNNKTTTIQNVNASANTGSNYAPRNISIGGQSGVIQTGNAFTNTSMLVAGNGNVALVGGENKGNGPGSGASVVLLNAGDRTRLNTTQSYENPEGVNNLNLLSVRQQCGVLTNCIADTGHNTSNRNINPNGDAGIIRTGNALIDLNAAIQGNMTSALRNNNSPGTNTLLSSLTNTGDDSAMANTSQQRDTTTIQSTNRADIDQNVRATANTGYNEASRNIAIGGDAGIIETGSAYIRTFLSVLANSNETQ